jgi:hypothetical protein
MSKHEHVPRLAHAAQASEDYYVENRRCLWQGRQVYLQYYVCM